MAGIVITRVSYGLRTGLLAALALMLAGCGGTVADALGMGKRAPDEFAVVRRQPLIIPPDFALRPPEPGAERPVVGRPSDRAYATLTGQSPSQNPQSPAGAPEREETTSLSAGQSALLARTRPAESDPDIRQRLAQEAGATDDPDRGLLTRLMAAPADQAQADGGGAPSVVRREQRPLDDLEDSF